VSTQTADERYIETQQQVEIASRILLGMDDEALGELIDRGSRAQGLGPLLHPTEWLAGTDKLREVLTSARALREARRKIAEVAS
jgi:hypothetical protein